MDAQSAYDSYQAGFVDVDTVRPGGICSTDAEHDAALERGASCGTSW